MTTTYAPLRRLQRIQGHLCSDTDVASLHSVPLAGKKETKRVLVLGGGLVGGVLAGDLSTDPRIKCTVADASEERLMNLSLAYPRLRTMKLDLGNPTNIREAAKKFEMVVGALPSWLGYNALKAVLEAGKNYVDISFMEQDFTELNALAKEKGLVAICDCGVAPGMSNMMCAAGSGYFTPGGCDSCVIYVGGIPQKPVPPFNYKAPFSPKDVLAEYTRESTVRVDGKITRVPALSELELVKLPQVPSGQSLEAFITDGLRSLARTIPAKNMCEKTLRWPGHQNFVHSLREAGFLTDKKIPIPPEGTLVSPMQVTCALLLPQWRQNLVTDPEFTAMRVILKGTGNSKSGLEGSRCQVIYDLYEETDITSNPRRSSMSRCTGYTCAVVARMVLFGMYATPGVHPPEVIGFNDGLFEHYRQEMAKKGVSFVHTVQIEGTI